ncbi:MAG: hypothetical protein JXB24_10190 [Bacteroidales bacterium]|nr:hypothetical protein [Bacteroidales bacterium]
MPLNDLFEYKLIESVEGSIIATIHIHANHRLFKGHFPGNPVTPGVTLIEIVRVVLSESVKKDLMLTEARDIKYLASIVPPNTDTINLEIKYKTAANGIAVNCVLSGNDQVYTKIRGIFSESK